MNLRWVNNTCTKLKLFHENQAVIKFAFLWLSRPVRHFSTTIDHDRYFIHDTTSWIYIKKLGMGLATRLKIANYLLMYHNPHVCRLGEDLYGSSLHLKFVAAVLHHHSPMSRHETFSFLRTTWCTCRALESTGSCWRGTRGEVKGQWKRVLAWLD